MRRARFSVAMSLDGYIAGPNGESDWIVMDPDIDFQALMGAFDAILLGGRRTRRRGGMAVAAGCPACRSTSSRARSARRTARA